MSQFRFRTFLPAVVVALVHGSLAQAAEPPVSDVLKFQPKQPGVIIANPTAAEATGYKVELVTGPGTTSGWALKDSKGQLVRKFVSTRGAKFDIDIWSYFLEGQEVYREMDTKGGQKKPNEYRWYGAGGMRWGVDVNADGRIDGWKMISAEEVSQEILKALVTRDPGRYQALLINEVELKNLELGDAENNRIRQSVSTAVAKFGQTQQALTNLSDKAQWLHLDVQAPQCFPADASGGKKDFIRHKNASVLYENGGKTELINIGELIQVGMAWRVVAGPLPGAANSESASNAGTTQTPDSVPESAKPLLKELEVVDKTAPNTSSGGPALVTYNMKRAAVLEKLAAAQPGKDGEQWVKQLADSLSTAAQYATPSEKAAQLKLVALHDKLVKDQPGSPLTAYVTFRMISAEYSAKADAARNGKPNAVTEVQEWWRDKLAEFVKAYPTAEDAPDAALNVAMVHEFMGKETEAKTWYTQIATNYAQHPLAPKATGALRRLALEGQPLELAGPTFGGGQFNIQQMKGKVVVVFYWATWNGSAASDFTKLGTLLKTYGPKGVELVTVNLDGNQNGVEVLRQAQLTGQHMAGPLGLDDPLATNYGITVLPNVFLVGKDGKVVSRTVTLTNLEDEVKKLTEK